MTENQSMEVEVEEWRKIPGFSENYEVSNLGRVKTVEHTLIRSNGRRQRIQERILSLSQDEWGYLMCRVDGKTRRVHRLVALAFIGEKPEGHEIRHIDGNPKNNNVSNLRYGTHSENVLDGYSYRGSVKRCQKLSISEAAMIKQLIKCGMANRRISELFSVSEQTICDIKKGRIYKGVAV